MADFAIIQTGGKQYKVAKGDKINVELLSNDTKEVTFDTLLTSIEGKTAIGKPLLKTKVKGEVIKQVAGGKIHIRTFKAKSRHRRHIGHRQKYSLVEIKEL